MKVKNKSPWGKFNNSDQLETHKESIHFDIEQNAIKVMGEDTLIFSKPVVITDNSEMWSGARYDIPTLDITEYKGKLTADHRDLIQNVLGNVIGVKKVANRKVTIDGIKLAVKENPLADYAKRMMLAGFLTDFSIETIGPWPDDDGVFKNAKLVGLSLVVTGNNKQAHINEIAKETMENAKANGLDVASFAQALKLPLDKENSVHDNNNMKFKKVKNSRGFAITLKFKNSDGEDTEATVQPGQTIDVPDTDANKDVETQVTDATEPKAPETPAQPETPATPEGGEDKGKKDTATIISKCSSPLQCSRFSFRVFVISPSVFSRPMRTRCKRFPFWAFLEHGSITIKNSITSFRNDVNSFFVKILHILKFPHIRHDPTAQLFFPLYLKRYVYHCGLSGKSLSSKFVDTSRLLPLLPLADSWGHSAPEEKSNRSVPSAICFSILSALSI